MDLVERMDVTEPEDVKTAAPLASNESLNEEYVYDFYSTDKPIDHQIFSTKECEIRHLSDADRDLFYFMDDDADDDFDAESIDSNDERHAVNDYPDEEENDTTSDDDEYDHYGENDDYDDYLDMDDA
uniref:Iwr1 domain-containing protein n=1 Tax=Panagrellus redivivus TaxID=6233 RepID=A0A7E4WBY1_PANRE